MKHLDVSGMRGTFEIKVLDPSKAPHGGIGPKVTLEDILAMPVKKNYKDISNMITRRGLSYFMYAMFGGQTSPYYVPEIVYNPTTNPYAAFVLSNSNNRPTWDESDTQYDANGGTDVRGITLSTTTGVFRRISVGHYNTGAFGGTTYKDMEYVFYIEPNSGTTYPLGLDGWAISSIGFAEGVAAAYTGNNSANRWGLRAVLGRPPRYQGVCDRNSVGEGTPTLYVSGPAGDNYMESGHTGSYSGDKAFDGVAADLAWNGTPNLGSEWQSVDNPGPHKIARLWASDKKLIGCRIIIPAGCNFNNVPNRFKIEYLSGADPSNEAHWTTLLNYSTGNDQANNIYSGEEYGYEYSWTAVTTKGLRISSMYAYATSSMVRVAELMCFEELNPGGSGVQLISGTNDKLRLAIDAPGTSFRDFLIGNVGPTKSVSTLVDALNAQLLGYELEAVRSTFGHLWIQATPNGANSKLHADDLANGSTANTPLGIGDTPSQVSGVNVPVTKNTADALTITYRMSLDPRI